MLTSSIKRKVLKAATAVAAASLTLPLLGSAPAQADPKQFTALVTVGSDTTQSILSAFTGESNGVLYTPLKSSAASGSRQIASWDAAGAGLSNCITPQAPGATILRPVGSTAGRKALSRAILGEKWGGPSCGTSDANGKAVAGLIHIARSSSKPSSGDTGTDLTYIPFARDALTFAYYANGVTPVTSLTRAQLVSLFSTGAQTINGVNIVPCGIQTNSGTFSAWNTTLGINTTQENTGTGACNAAGNGVRCEEHDSDCLKAKGDAQGSGKQYIIGMGAGPFISQWNGVAPDRVTPSVDLGSISDDGAGNNIGKPYTGTIGSIPANLSPVASFYNNATFGRDVYNVIDSALLAGPSSANQDYKTLLVGSTSAMCSNAADVTVQLFGFLLAPTCGSTTLKGSYIAGSV